MANTLRIKRRASGDAGAPSSLANAELAFNEVDDVLYYGEGTGGAGGSATQILAIGGSGAFATLSGTQTISGNKTFTGTLDFSGATIATLETTGNVTVGGNLTVNGTVSTINSTTVTVDDKNLELGSTASPSDATADGGGITLKGATDKTFNWVDATDSWTSSEHLDLASGKVFKIAGTSVLSGSTLGSGVTGSSLTSVGTITSGTWNGSTIAVANGGTGATSAGAARTNLGLVIGTDVQAFDQGLADIAGLAATDGNFIVGNGTNFVAESGATARASLGVTIGTNVQAWDADLDTLSGMQTGGATALAALTSTEIAILDGATVTTAELNLLDGVTATTSELNILDGVTATASELNIVDGGTSATATTLAAADRMVINDAGTMVQVALSDLVTFLENGTASGFELDGGVF